MSFLSGTEPAGFGCSVSRTGRKLGRRSLYTSLLPTASIRGCRSAGHVEISADGNGHSAETEDFEALQREELLRLYLEEPCSNEPAEGWGEFLVQWLKNHLYSLKERTLELVTPLKKRKAGQQPFTSTQTKRRTGERHGGIGSPQGGKERKTLLLSTGAEEARTTARLFWRRLLVGKWSGTFVLLPLCAAGVLILALALLRLHAESGEEGIPGTGELLQTTRNAAGDSIGLIQEELLQRARPSQHHQNGGRQREGQATHTETRYPSAALRTKGLDRDSVEVQNGDPTPVDFAASAATGSENLTRIPLRRWKRSDGSDGTGLAGHSPFTAELLHHLMLALARHQKKLPLVESGAPETTTQLQTDVIVRDFMNSQYTIEVDVGTPGQTVRAIADTGSSDFWACSEKCGMFCMLHKVYKHAKSSTYNPDNSPYNMTYVGGTVSGFLSTDNVSVGDLTAQHVLFAEADNIKGLGPAFFFGHFDGVLGMGLPATSTHGLKPLMQTAIEQQLLKKWVFAFYLSSDDRVDGELTLGGYDSSRIDGPIVYSALVGKHYWMINSQGLRVKNTLISKTTRVIVDTGTTLIAGPLDEVDHVAHIYGAFSVPMLPKGTYVISCDEALVLEDMTLMIEGSKFTVSAQDLIIRVSDIKGVPCLFGIIGLEVLEGKTRHKVRYGRTPAAEEQQLDTLQQRAAEVRGSVLGRLLAEEALLTAVNHPALKQHRTEDPPGSGVFATLPPEANPTRRNVQAVASADQVSATEELTSLGRLWIFGDVFMRGVYTIFDYDEKRIGFAKLRNKSAK